MEKSHFRINVAPTPEEVRPPAVLRKAVRRLLMLWDKRKEEKKAASAAAEKERSARRQKAQNKSEGKDGKLEAGFGASSVSWDVCRTSWRKPCGGCLLSAEEAAAAEAEASAARGEEGEFRFKGKPGGNERKDVQANGTLTQFTFTLHHAIITRRGGFQ